MPHWYPKLHEFTPRSLIFDERPDASAVGAHLGWPLFLKGERQTSQHRRSLSIIPDEAAFEQALDSYAKDRVLRWQRIVCREFRPLRAIEEVTCDRIPSSFEFRTFWWRGRLAGWGRYWWQGRDYSPDATERQDFLALAGEAVRRLALPFLVVDVAQEVNGYAGVSPFTLWQNILSLERGS